MSRSHTRSRLPRTSSRRTAAKKDTLQSARRPQRKSLPLFPVNSLTSAVSFRLGCSRAALGYFMPAGLEGLRSADNLWPGG